jgi:hypothetical protein
VKQGGKPEFQTVLELIHKPFLRRSFSDEALKWLKLAASRARPFRSTTSVPCTKTAAESPKIAKKPSRGIAKPPSGASPKPTTRSVDWARIPERTSYPHDHEPPGGRHGKPIHMLASCEAPDYPPTIIPYFATGPPDRHIFNDPAVGAFKKLPELTQLSGLVLV